MPTLSAVRTWLVLTSSVAGLLVACGGDDDTVPPPASADASTGTDASLTDASPAGDAAVTTLPDGALTCGDTQTDPDNCGSCGHACAAGTACTSGSCQLFCAGGTSQCGDSCATLKSDPANCGACGTTCGAGYVCSMGACALDCAPTLLQCSPTSATADAGAADAGDAGDAAAPDGGADAGLGAACVDPQEDPSNCGGCGISCGGSGACVAGSCYTLGWTLLPEPDSSGDDDSAGGFMDFLPAGQTTLFATPGGTELDLFDTVTSTWTAGAAMPLGVDEYTGGAFVGGKLYFIANPNVIAYDPVANTWATLAAETANLDENLNVHDDSGKVYTFSDDAAVIVYDTATNTATTVATTIPNDDVEEPRVVWDSTTKLLYIAPDFDDGAFYSVDPATGTTTTLTSHPEGSFNDATCGDRAGHIFAAGDSGIRRTYWVYDIATATWGGFSGLPFDKGDNGSCTISADGHLYLTSGEGNFAKTRLPTSGGTPITAPPPPP